MGIKGMQVLKGAQQGYAMCRADYTESSRRYPGLDQRDDQAT